MHPPPKLLLLTTTAACVAFASARAQNADATPPAPPAEVAPSAPAEAPPTELPPLRVTADLWESPLERIPASVSVYDETALAENGIRHFSDLADQIPNVTWSGGTSRARYFQVRGIGENSQYEGETPDASVRFQVDDLDFTGLGTVAGTFDVEQVEVLRGPQAGAFGANAAGGVVRLVTAQPTPYWTGLVEAMVGSDDLRAGGVAFGGPLLADDPEKLMMRVAIHQSRSDGFRRNVTLGRDTNARDEFMSRLHLTWNSSPVWRWDATLFFADADNGFDDFALDNNGENTFSDQPGRDTQESLAGSLRGTYSGWRDVRFTTITTATHTDSLYSYDSDWTAASYQGFNALERDREVFSQELRLDSAPDSDRVLAGFIHRWTLGVYFQRIDERSDYAYTQPGYVETMGTDYRADNPALFGQIAHDLTDRTRIILGLRAEHVDIRGDSVLDDGGAPVPLSARFDDTMFGGKLTVEHDLTDRHMVFASVARGYKAGGVNTDARIDPATDPVTYETETLWNYELGLRGNWFEQRLTGQFTAFYLDRRDTQIRDSAGFGGSYRFFVDNADRAHTYGIEASAAYALTDAWTLHGSVGLMESEIDPFTLTNGNTGGGADLANTPAYGYTVGLRYRARTGFFGNAEVVGRDEQSDSNTNPESRGAFTIVNASVGYAWANGWSVTVWGRNLFDETYEKRVFFFGNEDPLYTPTRYESRADPRQFGVTAAYRF